MPAPTTMLQFANQEKSAYQSEQTKAQAALAAAQQVLAQAQADLATLSADFAKLQDQVASIHKQLAVTPMPADAAALAQQLETTIIALRAKQAQLLDGDDAVDEAQSEAENAQADFDHVNAALAKATSDQANAQADDATRTAWKQAVAAAPLNTLKADAAAALAASPFTDAKTRIEGDIPSALITRARERGTLAVDRLMAFQTAATFAEDELSTDLDTNAGLGGKTQKRRVEFKRAQAAFGDYVQRAAERYDRALAVLAGVVSAPPLTQPEKDRITDVTIVAKGTAAATNEKARDDAEAAKQAALDDATLVALEADPDADVSGDPNVSAAATALQTSQTALTAAQNAYTAQNRKDLDTWEAAVPDSSWNLLAQFEEAKLVLTSLSTVDPTALATAMKTAESAYAGALFTEAQGARTTWFLTESAKRRADRLATATKSGKAHVFGALRGDG